jgi:two-component system, LuxR family, sensor kinase FixL
MPPYAGLGMVWSTEGMPSNEADALHALGITAARWQAILDTAQDAIICITQHGEITLFNAAAERMFGYAADEAVGRNVRMLMPAPYREEHDGYIRGYLETGAAKAIGRVRQVAAERKDGTTFPIELSVSQARVGNDVLFNAIIRDTSWRERVLAERMELTRRLEQGQRLGDIGAMTARIAHDFGNPLAGLLMTAQQILRRIERDASQPAENLRPQAERLLMTAQRLDAMLHDFRDFAREQRLNLEPVALAPFLQDVVCVWQVEADNRGVGLQLSSVDDLTVHIDRDKCQRVFDNLLKNALEAVDHGPGEVRVQMTQLGGEQVRISITDTGPGVPDGLDVFALFETTKPHGTGLGLPICKQIVTAHGGGLDFAGVSPHGTVFNVQLPIAGPPIARAR